MRRLLFVLGLTGCSAAVTDASTSTASDAANPSYAAPAATAEARPPMPPPTSGIVPAAATSPPSAVRPAPAAAPAPAEAESLRIETSGPLSNTEERVLKTVALCVRTASEKGSPSGKPLDVELTVDATGRVTDVRLAKGYAAPAAKCVRDDLTKMSFQARPEGGVQFYKYPILEVSEED
jgi:hypothetical protein